MTRTFDVSRDRVSDIIGEMEANGASFSYQAANGGMPASFVYSLPKGGDRWKCRGLVVEAKANPMVWAALVAEIGRRYGGGADVP